MTSQAVFVRVFQSAVILTEDAAGAIAHLNQPTVNGPAYVQQVEHQIMQNTTALRTYFGQLQNKNEFPNAKQSRALEAKYILLRTELGKLDGVLSSKGASVGPIVNLLSVVNVMLLFFQKMMQIYTADEIKEDHLERQDVAIIQEAIRFFTQKEYTEWKASIASDARFGGLVASHKYSVALNVKADLTKLNGFETQLGTAVSSTETALQATLKAVDAAHAQETEELRKNPNLSRIGLAHICAGFWATAEKEAKTVEKEIVNINQLEKDIGVEISRLIGELHDPLAAQEDSVLVHLRGINQTMESNLHFLINLMQRLINHITARYI